MPDLFAIIDRMLVHPVNNDVRIATNFNCVRNAFPINDYKTQKVTLIFAKIAQKAKD